MWIKRDPKNVMSTRFYFQIKYPNVYIVCAKLYTMWSKRYTKYTRFNICILEFEFEKKKKTKLKMKLKQMEKQNSFARTIFGIEHIQKANSIGMPKTNQPTVKRNIINCIFYRNNLTESFSLFLIQKMFHCTCVAYI